MRVGRQLPRAFGTATVGTVKDLHVLSLQMRRTLHGHGAANMLVRSLDFFGCEAHASEHVKGEIAKLRVGKAQNVATEVIAKAEPVEGELELECRAQGRFDGLQLLFVKTFGPERFAVDPRRVGKRTGVNVKNLQLLKSCQMQY